MKPTGLPTFFKGWELIESDQTMLTTPFDTDNLGGSFRCWHHPLFRESEPQRSLPSSLENSGNRFEMLGNRRRDELRDRFEDGRDGGFDLPRLRLLRHDSVQPGLGNRERVDLAHAGDDGLAGKPGALVTTSDILLEAKKRHEGM